jgi:hypothetical protein
MRPNSDERERQAPLGPNVVGFDAKGQLNCDPFEPDSASRRDESELFLCERTGKLYLVHPGDAKHARLWQIAETRAAAREFARAELETRLQAVEAQAGATDASLREALKSLNEMIRQNSYLKDRRVWAGLVFRTDGRPTKLLRRILFHANGKPRGLFRRHMLHTAAKPGTALHYWLSSPAYLALPRAKRPPSES